MEVDRATETSQQTRLHSIGDRGFMVHSR